MEYYPGLVLYARRYLNDMAAAEDVVQDCFAELWHKRVEIQNSARIKAFLYVSVRNRCLNYIRDHHLRLEHYQKYQDELNEDEEQAMVEDETLRLLSRALEKMSEQARIVCKLSLDGLKNEEIAEQLFISLNTVKYHKKQIHKILRSVIGNAPSALVVLYLAIILY